MPRSLIHKLRVKLAADSHSREMLLGSMTGILVKVLAAVSAFAMNLVVARYLGAEEAGLFFLSLTIITIIAAISRMGLDNTVVRYISANFSIGNSPALHGIYRKSIIWVMAISTLATLTLLLAARHISNSIFNKPELDPVISCMAFAIPLIALYTINSQALQGLKMIARAMTVLNVSTPIILLTTLLLLRSESAESTSSLFVFSTALTALLGFYWWARCSPKLEARPSFSNAAMLASCLPLWGAMIFNQVIQWSSQLMLGIWGSTADVALFASAQRTAMLNSFILVAVNSIAAPKFSAMFHHGDINGLRRMALLSTRLMWLAAIPVLLMILIFPEWIMGLFGQEFQQASAALCILALGQFVNIATGSVGFLLMMSGHERHLRTNTLIGAILGVGLGLLLIPDHGIIGAAISSAIAVASQNILGVYQVNRTLGFNTLEIWKRL